MSFFIVAAVYIAAFFCGLLIFFSLKNYPLPAFFLADVAATVVVWFSGIILNNTSLYDPYWSVAPLVLVAGFIVQSGMFEAAMIIYAVILAVWGVRLTANWAAGWNGLRHVDWRYRMLRQQNPKLWPITNFFGINMMPTLVVFAAMLPVFFVSQFHSAANPITFIGAALCIAAICIQALSDAQMRRFRKASKDTGANMVYGLWRYSRHPNYLGEISFWWGVWLIQLSVLPALWWTVFAPFLITLLFVFISIPMMEKKLLSTKNGYADYQTRTSMLLLLPIKQPQSDQTLNT